MATSIGVPILTQYKQHVAELLATASGLTADQTIQLVEERFEDEVDLSVAMMKIKKFKINGDPAEVAAEWVSKVRFFQSPSHPTLPYASLALAFTHC